jgi:hypothetical protein
MTQKLFSVLAVGFFMLLGVGCCPVTKLNVSIEADEAFRQKYPNGQVTIDLVAVKPQDKATWEKYSMTQYWSANDAMRASATDKITLTIDASKKDPQVVTVDNPKWDTWLANATKDASPCIFVMASSPGTYSKADDKDGDLDPRRKILPTFKCRWTSDSMAKTPPINLVVSPSPVGLRLITILIPE